MYGNNSNYPFFFSFQKHYIKGGETRKIDIYFFSQVDPLDFARDCNTSFNIIIELLETFLLMQGISHRYNIKLMLFVKKKLSLN